MWLLTIKIVIFGVGIELNQDIYYWAFSPNSPLAIAHVARPVVLYRIGDGTGGTYVGPANNCSQDANQALYAAIKQVERVMKADADFFKDWAVRHPEQGERFEQLVKLGKSLKGELLPLGTARADWQNNDEVLGISLEDYPLKSLLRGLGSWRTMLPRVASDTVVKLFLEQGASIWVLRTNQVGGFDPDIEPIAPMTF